MIFRIRRWLYFISRGVGKKEKQHYLFTLEQPLTAFELYQRLADAGYQPNDIGYVYKGQIYQARKLHKRGQFQWHLRAYDDGKITCHYETSQDYDVSDHLFGSGLRDLTEEEKQEIKCLLASLYRHTEDVPQGDKNQGIAHSV